MTEELISQVGRAAPDRLSVIASATALMYKGSAKSPARIGAELGVRFILTGSVRRADKRIRTTVELVNAADQSQVCTESYDSELSDILQLQTEVAHSVAERVLRTVLPSAMPTGSAIDAQAYDHYLRARFLWNRRNEVDITRALDHFERAIKLDPSYAAAHAGLADCFSLLASTQFAAMPPNEAMPKARAASSRALALDPGLAHAHTSAGRRQHAQQMLDSLARRAKRRYIPAFYFAAIHAGLRDAERTIFYLRKAREERCDYLLHLHHEPAADSIRSDPRFAELVPRPK